jgi:hypothetical protein
MLKLLIYCLEKTEINLNYLPSISGTILVIRCYVIKDQRQCKQLAPLADNSVGSVLLLYNRAVNDTHTSTLGSVVSGKNSSVQMNIIVEKE